MSVFQAEDLTRKQVSPESAKRAWSEVNTTRWLAATVAVAVLLRVISSLLQGDAVTVTPGAYDQISYNTLARRVLEGHGFTFPVPWWPATAANEPTAHWSFLYTLYLTGVYGLFGAHPLAARLIQSLLAGLLHPWLSWRIGRRLFGSRSGLAAAAIAAVYPYFVYYAGALMTETLYIVAVLWVLDLTMRMADASRSPQSGRDENNEGGVIGRIRLRRWVALGLALGTAVLLRQVILVLVPAILVWLVWRFAPTSSGQPAARRLRGAILGGALTMTVVCLMIVPWSVRNFHAFGRFVLLNTNSGYVFFWANHPIYGTNFVPILPDNNYYQLIPPELRHLDEAALDQALLREGIGFVVEDPKRYVLLSISRVRDLFMFWPSSQSSLVSNIARVSSFGMLLPVSLAGIFLAGSRRRRYVREGQTPAVVLIGGFAVFYSLIHILSWSLIRYRLPVDAVLVVFAGLIGSELVSLVTRSTQR